MCVPVISYVWWEMRIGCPSALAVNWYVSMHTPYNCRALSDMYQLVTIILTCTVYDCYAVTTPLSKILYISRLSSHSLLLSIEISSSCRYSVPVSDFLTGWCTYGSSVQFSAVTVFVFHAVL